ncbi:peptidoglycan endopeptidase RipA [Mycolicibacterium insubricum]|uniref:Peptidase M23 n=3 Tax=Mycolicibacterium insubricum TaxID=444597 RepID=A0A1X0DGU1_9MYCO|nr:NlpC/P60 family peptidoglycan endopeptidase RipA [Mycolicibacterium insubricum]ORA71050.1 peptidase M23 [Mycolicibacterium insubricum]BBZ67027.1 peptidoglycan endopeptidase RipA [Mycolicibacterium insubricum]
MRLIHGASPLLTVALLLGTAGQAGADPAPAPDGLGALIAAVAEANQRLDELGAQVQTQQESVNKSLVEVQTARDNAATAQTELAASQQSVRDCDGAIADAQSRFDDYAVQTYMNGPSDALLTASNPDEVIQALAADDAVANVSNRVMGDLKRTRTEQANRESRARLAKEKADAAAADAKTSQDNAVVALQTAQAKFGDQQGEINKLAAERDAARARLNEARAAMAPSGPATSGPANPATPPAVVPESRGQAAPRDGDWDRAPAGAAPPYGDASQWDTTLPMVPSAFVSGDPIAIVNEVLNISSSSAQVTAGLGKKFLQKLGILAPDATGITNNGAIPRVYGRQASEYVINRGMAVRGTPYSWGGGNASGPTNGIDSGAGTVGFDCSGLVLYSFAGVGIQLPHYSGSQYNMGRKIPSAEMRRGDVIFYGPGGSQHVTIYLGDGQMLEAPYTGSVVKVSPVRTSGMTPYVVRYIEY